MRLLFTIDCVAYLMTYELHVLEVCVYGASNAVLYCMDSTLQRLRAVCAATARLLSFHVNRPSVYTVTVTHALGIKKCIRRSTYVRHFSTASSEVCKDFND